MAGEFPPYPVNFKIKKYIIQKFSNIIISRLIHIQITQLNLMKIIFGN